MKRKLLALASTLLLASTLAACGGSKPAPTSEPEEEESEAALEPGDYSVLVWVDTKIKALTESQLAAFKNTLPEGVNVSFEVKAVGEGSAAGNMITDPEKGADVYGFAQDQLARLVTANALAPIAGSMKKTLEARNTAASIDAAKSGRSLYAFPMTDNGYFLYYDKSIISAEEATDVTSILAAVSRAGKTFAFDLKSGYYNAAYFFGAGCESTWKTNSSGKFTSYVDTYAEKGLDAAKGIREIVTHEKFVNGSDAGTVLGGDSAAVVSGTWDYNAAKEKLGVNFAAAELPHFKVGDKDYHLGSFSGYKLIGVKPQQDANKAAICQMVASYLTDKAAQLARFESNGWGPTNNEALALDEIKQNEALNALHAQDAYSSPQGQYPGTWWDTAAAITTDIQDLGANSTDAELQAVLDTYNEALPGMIGTK